MPTFEMFVLTVPSREKTLADTLLSVRASDWNDTLVVRCQPPGPENWREGVKSYRKMLTEHVAGSPADFVVVIEDDVDVAKNLRHNLAHWSVLPQLQVGSLFLPGRLHGKVRWVDYGPDFSTYGGGFVYGTQAMVFKPAAVAALMPVFDAVDNQYDQKLFAACRAMGVPVHYHTPALVQHRDVTSSMANDAVMADPTYAPFWRAT